MTLLSVFSSKDYFPSESFSFIIRQYTIQPKEIIPLHTHEFFELVFVKSGNAEHVMANQTYRLQAGDVFVVEPSVYHSYNGSEDEETQVYNVLFHLDVIRRDLESLMQISSFISMFYLTPFLRRTSNFVPYLSLTSDEAVQLVGYLDLLMTELHEQDSGFELAAKTLLMYTLIFLSRCYERHIDSTHAMPHHDPDMDTIMAFIRENHRVPLSVKQISLSFGMSLTTLITKFKQYTGMTVLEYKHQLQVQEACSLLTHTNDKILAIAHAVGFDDLSFFYRIFRRMTGMTPAQYRKSVAT